MASIATLKDALAIYQPVIGLEVHAQLLVSSKLFTRAPADYDPNRPNHFTSEYCFGLPGVLPVLNKAAVELAMRAGLALGCTINERSTWSRKHYFYPDSPKGYQITQYDEPIAEHGKLMIKSDSGDEKKIRIHRIHMEEDAGKLMHVEGAPYSLVDFNRAGFALVEIVTDPDLRSAQEATAYLRELRSILMTLGVCDGNMEEGSFRCDANVSLMARGSDRFGTRCELKNINSFKFIEQAIEHEIVRHAKVLQGGGAIVQETRLYDSAKKETRSMRGKEDAHDYRYFPDPDLPPLSISKEWIAAVKTSLPELPPAKRRRYLEELKIPEEHAIAFSEDARVAEFFDAAVAAFPEGALPIAHLVKGDVLRELKDAPDRLASLSAAETAKLVRAKEEGKISSTQQKKLLAEIWNGARLEELLAKEGSQVDDAGVLEPMIAELVAKYPKEVARLKAGDEKVSGFFLGQIMKATGGKAKPQVVRELLMKKISEPS
jgi:aspartyl-tRNA(Asn)/glutamyl-tRNA(Gln) amidotransferase subunit B